MHVCPPCAGLPGACYSTEVMRGLNRSAHKRPDPLGPGSPGRGRRPQIGVVSTQDALRQAQELDLDLVEVAPQANPPVCRIMDYGKFKYERDVRQKEARKKQSRSGLKEIKFRPKIDPHDYATKKGHVERFLKGGNKVKVTIMFRGREMAHTELGRKILDRLVGDLGETIVVESMPKQEGRNMIMVISPNKRYLEAQAKAQRAEEGSPTRSRHRRGDRDHRRRWSKRSRSPRPSRSPMRSRPPTRSRSSRLPQRERRVVRCRR